MSKLTKSKDQFTITDCEEWLLSQGEVRVSHCRGGGKAPKGCTPIQVVIGSFGKYSRGYGLDGVAAVEHWHQAVEDAAEYLDIPLPWDSGKWSEPIDMAMNVAQCNDVANRVGGDIEVLREHSTQSCFIPAWRLARGLTYQTLPGRTYSFYDSAFREALRNLAKEAGRYCTSTSRVWLGDLPMPAGTSTKPKWHEPTITIKGRVDGASIDHVSISFGWSKRLSDCTCMERLKIYQHETIHPSPRYSEPCLTAYDVAAAAMKQGRYHTQFDRVWLGPLPMPNVLTVPPEWPSDVAIGVDWAKGENPTASKQPRGWSMAKDLFG